MTSPPLTQSHILQGHTSLAHGFFGARGGVSKGLYRSLNAGAGSADAPEAVVENRARIAKAIGAAQTSHLLSCHQYHSAQSIFVSEPFAEPPKADAMVTDQPGLALAILTADCVPVLFFDPVARLIGAAHAGWKGALAGIGEACLDMMCAHGAEPSRTLVAIGPAIGPGSYQVGPEFYQTFISASPQNTDFFQSGTGDRYMFDVPAYVRARLVLAGIKQIDMIAHDTCALEGQYFSNRRRVKQGQADYGRNASVIMLRPDLI